MTDWYRRSDWNDKIAADFEARLARARAPSRAQYLSLQGCALIAAHADIAEQLLERCLELGEASELPRAACYLALARLAQGDVDGSIRAYDRAVEAERASPAFRSTAAVDQALLIGLFNKSDRYWDALDRLAMAGAGPLDLVDFEATAAEALIRAGQGDADTAREKARQALTLLGDNVADATWGGVSLAQIRQRLETIA